jgi:hypothetical protein
MNTHELGSVFPTAQVSVLPPHPPPPATAPKQGPSLNCYVQADATRVNLKQVEASNTG